MYCGGLLCRGTAALCKWYCCGGRLDSERTAAENRASGRAVAEVARLAEEAHTLVARVLDAERTLLDLICAERNEQHVQLRRVSAAAAAAASSGYVAQSLHAPVQSEAASRRVTVSTTLGSNTSLNAELVDAARALGGTRAPPSMHAEYIGMDEVV